MGEEPKAKKPMNVKVVQRKKSILRGLVTDDIPEAKEYFIENRLKPGLKDAAFNLLTQFLEIFIYRGSDQAPRVPTSTLWNSLNPNTPYNRIYQGNAPQVVKTSPTTGRAIIQLNDIYLGTKFEADDVLAELRRHIASEYHFASVANLYDALQMTSPEGFPDQDYGWYNLDNVVPKYYPRYGYSLNLPKPQPRN